MMRPSDAIRPHKIDPIKDPYLPVRWNDRVHDSVMYRADHNNPPKGCHVVNDDTTTPMKDGFKRP
ncbi:MAG: hypothetical protein ACREWG_10745, partial [Gammaproteobacteria bacterium]